MRRGCCSHLFLPCALSGCGIGLILLSSFSVNLNFFLVFHLSQFSSFFCSLFCWNIYFFLTSVFSFLDLPFAAVTLVYSLGALSDSFDWFHRTDILCDLYGGWGGFSRWGGGFSLCTQRQWENPIPSAHLSGLFSLWFVSKAIHSKILKCWFDPITSFCLCFDYWYIGVISNILVLLHMLLFPFF